MTSANTPATCAFPGCERPVRPKAGDGGGKPPIYCDLLNPATGKYAHTSLTAAREQARLDRGGAGAEQLGDLAVEAPASAARTRAQSLLDQFRSEMGQMTGTLQAAIEAVTSASDPESVSTELKAARRQIERTRLETAEQVSAAEQTRDQALAEAETLRTEAGEARTARDEAITELETTEATLAELRQEQEQERADHAAEVERLRAEHRRELETLRAETEQQITGARTEAAEEVAAAQQRAADEIRTAQAEAAGRVQAAEQTRDQAAAEATAARQSATDATRRADEAREELRQARAEHREELAALRREHRDEVTAERQRGDAAVETLRAEHRREIEALQEALAALRVVAQPDAEPPQQEEATEQRKRRSPRPN